MKWGGLLKGSPSPSSFAVIKKGILILQTWSYPVAAHRTQETILCSLRAILFLEIMAWPKAPLNRGEVAVVCM